MPSSDERFVNTTQVADLSTTHARIELAQDSLRQFGVLRMRATGGSMLPAIAPGDVLTFRACTAEQATPGQVVLMRHPHRFVAHRVIDSKTGTLLTRGDALAAADGPVPANDVLGVLVGQQRGQQQLHAGGRYWLKRQRATRWLIQRVQLIHRLLCRVPALNVLTV